MAHAEQLRFIELIKRCFPDHFNGTTVFEVGSLDINGSIRSFFDGATYTGVDVGAGPGVDIVTGGQLVDLPSESSDVVVSCECLEHNPYWVETLSNMFRIAKPGGLVIMSCASPGREEHGTTRTTPHHSPLTVGAGWEYYCNLSEADIRRTFPNLNWWFGKNYVFATHYGSMDTYFVGLKKPDTPHAVPAIVGIETLLRKECRPRASKRAFAIWCALKLGGERGVAALRSLSRLTGVAPRSDKYAPRQDRDLQKAIPR